MKKFTFCFLVCIFSVFHGRNMAYSAEIQEKLDSCVRYIQQMQDSLFIPGMQVTIMQDNVVLWSKSFGYTDINKRTPVRSYTKFRIASLSKMLTSLSVMKLLEEHKISLDSTIQTYLPNYPKAEFPITIRNLLSHTSGIRHYRGNEFSNPNGYKTMTGYMNIFKNDTLLFQPNTKSAYSSYGYIILGAIIEKVSGESFPSFVSENILSPLGLHRIMPDAMKEKISNRTKFYTMDKKGIIRECPPYDMSYKLSTGGYLSTSYDFSKLCCDLMDGCVLNDSIAEIYLTPVTLNDRTASYWTPGLRYTQLNKKHTAYWHLGSSHGVSSAVAFDPKTKLSICWLTNMNVNWSERPILTLMRYMLDIPIPALYYNN